MCDYSLAALRTRLAAEGEELVTYRFPSGTIGLASPAELERQKKRHRGWFSWFTPFEPPCAVCIPPGAQLMLHEIPKRLQTQFGLHETESVVFVQTSANAGQHRDGVRFANNQEILLQRLAEGQHVLVQSLSCAEAEAVPFTEDLVYTLR